MKWLEDLVEGVRFCVYLKSDNDKQSRKVIIKGL